MSDRRWTLRRLRWIGDRSAPSLIDPLWEIGTPTAGVEEQVGVKSVASGLGFGWFTRLRGCAPVGLELTARAGGSAREWV